MKILDERFGIFGWQRKHEFINGKEYCTVSVRSENGEWVSKQDCGTESNAEREKGQSSDAFKRACFNWGIGRELYTAPFIWIKKDKVSLSEKNGKIMTYDKFSVEKIQYENRKITAIAIWNDTQGRRAFVWQDPSYKTEKNATLPNGQ